MSTRILITIPLFIFLHISTVFSATSVVTAEHSFATYREMTVEDMLNTRPKDLEVLLGKTLNWEEKWAFRIIRRKLENAVRKNPGLALLPLATFNGLASGERDGNAFEPERKTSGLAFGSSLLGIVSAVTIGMTLPALIAGLLAVVIGILGLRAINRRNMKGRGFAWLGIIVGASVLSILFFIGVISLGYRF